MSMIQVRTVNLQEIALALNSEAKPSSSYRRIQRFFVDFFFRQEDVLGFVLAQLPSRKELVLCLDRTNWKFGIININILAVGVVYKGIAFPVLWLMLDKQGNSNQAEREKLMRILLKHIPVCWIKALVADREFIGKDWIAFLHAYKIPYHIRIRKNILYEHEPQSLAIYTLFAHLPYGQILTLHNSYTLFAQSLRVTGIRLKGDKEDEYLILISNTNPEHALECYRHRWEIESFFKAIKSAGFDFEATHLRHAERIDTLLSLVTLALVWCHKTGEYLHRFKPIPTKNHGYKALSFFRHGLDFLRSILFHLQRRLDDLHLAFSLLSCT
ncbi:MAG: IS4 family transposase [Deinococcales bacterium]